MSLITSYYAITPQGKFLICNGNSPEYALQHVLDNYFLRKTTIAITEETTEVVFERSRGDFDLDSDDDQ